MNTDIILATGTGVENIALWAGAGAMLVGTLVHLYLGRNVAVYQDRFFVMATAITLIAGTAYLAMALGMGRVTVNGEEIFVIRYLDWLLTTPLILVLLGILANANRSTITSLIGLDVYMIVTGALGAVAGPLWQALLWWTISTVAFLILLYLLLGVLSRGASEQPDDLVGIYKRLRNLTVVLWSIYPVIWIAGTHGFGVLPTTVESVSFVVLDVLAKVVFGFILLSSHETIRVQSFYVSSRERESSPGQAPADD